MRAWIFLFGLVTSLWAPSCIAAQTAGSAFLRDLVAPLQEVFRAESKRLVEINYYVERLIAPQTVVFEGLPDGQAGPCATNCVAYKVEATDAGGETVLEALILSGLEVAELAKLNPAPSFLRAYSASALATQEAFNDSVNDAGGMSMIEILLNNYNSQGAPIGGDLDGSNSEIMNPFSLLRGASWYTATLAEEIDNAKESLAKTPERAQTITDQKLALASQLRENGTEMHLGVEGTRYSTPILSQPLPTSDGADGIEGEINRAHLLVDLDRKLILKQRIEGNMTRDGETQEFFIEVVNTDFRNPPGCDDLVKPFRRVTRMGGILTEAEREQMAEAQAQLAEFEQQMAAMPPNQREMAERMMGGQMDMIRSMASGGAMESTQELEQIYCNPDLAALFGVGPAPMVTSPEQLLRQIQLNLVTLGYEPGNTNGELDTMTQIAISQYQAERGLSVTGEPSQALAEALAADVANRGR